MDDKRAFDGYKAAPKLFIVINGDRSEKQIAKKPILLLVSPAMALLVSGAVALITRSPTDKKIAKK
jgi:hypothetical protein